MFFPAVEVIGALAIALILWYGGGGILAGTVTFGVVVAFIQYAERFYQPVRDLSEKYNMIMSAMVASERIFELLDTPPAIPEPAAPRAIGRLRGAVEFDRVWFAYQGEDWVLRDVSFRVAPGEKVAIVGATGAGKTTIANLLCRFYEFQKGAIRVDGVDIREIEGKTLRRQIGLVLQDVFLFSGSVRRERRLRRSRRGRRRGRSGAGRGGRLPARGAAAATASTRRWASAAPTCRWASGRSSPSRARSTTTRAS